MYLVCFLFLMFLFLLFFGGRGFVRGFWGGFLGGIFFLGGLCVVIGRGVFLWFFSCFSPYLF